MKKLMCLVLAVCLCALVFAACGKAAEPTPAPQAAEPAALRLDGGTAAPGEEVAVTVNISANSGIAANDLIVTFDPDVLVYQSFQQGAAFAGGIADANLVDDGRVKATMATLKPSKEGGVWCTFTFQVKPDAPAGETPLTLEAPVCVNYDEEDVVPVLAGDSVTVKN